VYLGDALQWSVSPMLGREQVEILVPAPPEGGDRAALRFPVAVAEDPGLFDAVVAALLAASERDAGKAAAEATLRSMSPQEIGDLASAYEQLRALNRTRRDHVWGYYARNIARPVWLSRRAGRVDRVIGNPPWLSFRCMSEEMQAKAKAGMKYYDI
jgi:hypothetical protein